MIIIKLKGGLGNQLFQYAFGRLLSIQRNDMLLLDTTSFGEENDTYRLYGLNPFSIRAKIASETDIKKAKYPLGLLSKLVRFFNLKILRKFHIGWDESVLKTEDKYIEGYWQSYKYPELIRNELLEEIKLLKPIENMYSEILEKMKSTDSVSLHVRRGDYVSDPRTSRVHNICDLDYYARAISIISNKTKKPNFFLFSDDIEWVKNNLKISFPVS